MSNLCARAALGVLLAFGSCQSLHAQSLIGIPSGTGDRLVVDPVDSGLTGPAPVLSEIVVPSAPVLVPGVSEPNEPELLDEVNPLAIVGRLERFASTYPLSDFDLPAITIDLAPEVQTWADAIAAWRPDLDRQDIYAWLDTEGMSFTSPTREVRLDWAQPTVETSFTDGTALHLTLSDLGLRAVAEQASAIQFQLTACTTETLQHSGDPDVLPGMCYVVESSVGSDWIDLVDLTILPTNPVRAGDAYAVTYRLPGSGPHSAGLVDLSTFPIPVSVTDGQITASGHAGHRTAAGSMGVPRPARPDGAVVHDGGTITVVPGASMHGNCMTIMRNGAYFMTNPNTLEGNPAPGIDTGPRVFRLCGVDKMRAFLNSGANAINLSRATIATRWAKIWRDLTGGILDFPYVGSRPWRTELITVNWVAKAKDERCGDAGINIATSAVRPTIAKATDRVTIKPIVTLYGNTPKSANHNCYRATGGRVDWANTFAHEVAHILIDMNRAILIEDEYQGRRVNSLRELYRVMKMPLWAHEMVAEWVVDVIFDDSSTNMPGTGHVGAGIASGAGSLRGEQTVLDTATRDLMKDLPTGGYTMPPFVTFLTENESGRRNTRVLGGNVKNALTALLGPAMRNLHPECYAGIARQLPDAKIKHVCDNEHTSGFAAIQAVTRRDYASALALFAEQFATCEVDTSEDLIFDGRGKRRSETVAETGGFYYLDRRLYCQRIGQSGSHYLRYLMSGSKVLLDMRTNVQMSYDLASWPERTVTMQHRAYDAKLRGHRNTGGMMQRTDSLAPDRAVQVEHIVEWPISRSATVLRSKLAAAGTRFDCANIGGGMLVYQRGGAATCLESVPSVHDLAVQGIGNSENQAFAIMEMPYGSMSAHTFELANQTPAVTRTSLQRDIADGKAAYRYMLDIEFWCLPPSDSLAYNVDLDCSNIDMLVLHKYPTGGHFTERVNLGEYVKSRSGVRALDPQSYNIEIGAEAEDFQYSHIQVIFINKARIEDFAGLSAFPAGESWPSPATQFGLSVSVGLREVSSCTSGIEQEGPDGKCICSLGTFVGDRRALTMTDWTPEHSIGPDGKQICRMTPPCRPDQYWFQRENGSGTCYTCPGESGRSYRTGLATRSFDDHFRCTSCQYNARRSNSLVATFWAPDGRRLQRYEEGARPMCACPNDIPARVSDRPFLAAALADHTVALREQQCYFPCAPQDLSVGPLTVLGAHYWNTQIDGCELGNARVEGASRCCSLCNPGAVDGMENPGPERRGCRGCYGTATFVQDRFNQPRFNQCLAYSEFPGRRSQLAADQEFFTGQRVRPLLSTQPCPPGSGRAGHPGTCVCTDSKVVLSNPATQTCFGSCTVTGAVFDPRTQSCACPGGGTVVNGKCGCPSGMEFRNGSCQTKVSCKPDEVKVGSTCVPAALRQACCNGKVEFAQRAQCVHLNWSRQTGRARKCDLWTESYCPANARAEGVRLDPAGVLPRGVHYDLICIPNTQSKPSLVACVSGHRTGPGGQDWHPGYCCIGNKPPVRDPGSGQYVCR